MALFEHQHELACPVQSAFEFLARPKNVIELGHPEARTTMLSSPDVIHHGAELEFEIEVYGQKRALTHRIIQFEPPARFVEEMIDGPMRQWLHEHVFEESPLGVRLIDRVTFETPGGLVGMILTEAKVQSSLEQGFRHRKELLEDLVQRGELQ